MIQAVRFKREILLENKLFIYIMHTKKTTNTLNQQQKLSPLKF